VRYKNEEKDDHNSRRRVGGGVVGVYEKAVLVIDDAVGILDVVTIMLEMEGYEVVKALDAFIVLAPIETTAPNLILLDVVLSTMSGYECIEQLRQHHDAILILLFTVLKHTPEEVEQLGVAGYLRKPFHRSELLHKVKELLVDPGYALPEPGLRRDHSNAVLSC
jgi:DNA-binding response OmpR family regulator